MKEKWNAVACIVRHEFCCIFLNARMLTLGMFFAFLYQFVVVELLGKAAKTGIPINVSEVFVALGNSDVLMLFLPAVFLLLYSDFPNMGAYSLYLFPRSGRLSWLWGKVLSSLLGIGVFLGLLYLFGCLAALPGGKFGLDWSDTVSKYLSRYPEDRGCLMVRFLPPNLYNHFRFPSILLHTMLLLFLYLFALSLLLIFFRAMGMKTAGIISAFTLVGCGVVTCFLNSDAKWLFPMAHSVTWRHYQEAFREPVMPLWASYLYFAGLIAAELLLDVMAVRKMNINEEEI